MDAIIGGSGLAKLADFGIARSTESTRTMLTMAPDLTFISDAQLTTAFTSTGARIRYLLQRSDVGAGAPATLTISSTLLTFNVSGFDVTR
jgi:hypothetical protein